MWRTPNKWQPKCAQAQNPHLIVVWTEVLEMAEAGVADTDEDSDAQNHQSE